MVEHLGDAWAALADPSRCEHAREIAETIPLGPGPDGRTALALAAAAGADEIGLLLLERGADPLFAGEGDWTPLRKASLSGSTTLVRALIARGALVDREGEAALASFGRHRRVAAEPDRGLATVATLLDAGADPHGTSVIYPDVPILQQAGRSLLARRISPAASRWMRCSTRPGRTRSPRSPACGRTRSSRSTAGARIGTEALVRWLGERGVQAAPTTHDPPGPPGAAVPVGARPARVIDGMFKGFDAHVTLRPDGRYDAVVAMFGRGVPAILGPSELRLLEP